MTIYCMSGTRVHDCIQPLEISMNKALPRPLRDQPSDASDALVTPSPAEQSLGEVFVVAFPELAITALQGKDLEPEPRSRG